MQFKRYCIFVLFAGIFLLSACNLAVVTPVPLTSPTPTASRVVVAPTNTLAPLPLVPQTPTATLALVLPTPTLTLFYNPTATSTPSLAECPLIITQDDTNSGDILHIRRCEDNVEYDLGPLAKGVFAVGPNNKFLVYVTNSGLVYVNRIGQKELSLVVNLRREGSFVAVNKNVRPVFTISFYGEEPHYKLILSEKKYNQRRAFYLPVRIQE